MIRTVIACDKDWKLTNKRWEVSCKIEDFAMRAAAQTRRDNGKIGDEERVEEVLSEIDDKLTGASLQLQVREDGRVDEAKDLSLEVYDREYFVDFSFAEKDPVKLVGAPAQCKLSVARPQEMSAALSQQLSQLGPNQRDPSLTVGAEFANKILVKCP